MWTASEKPASGGWTAQHYSTGFALGRPAVDGSTGQRCDSGSGSRWWWPRATCSTAGAATPVRAIPYGVRNRSDGANPAVVQTNRTRWSVPFGRLFARRLRVRVGRVRPGTVIGIAEGKRPRSPGRLPSVDPAIDPDFLGGDPTTTEVLG